MTNKRLELLIEKFAIISSFPKEERENKINEYHNYFIDRINKGSSKLDAYYETNRYMELRFNKQD